MGVVVVVVVVVIPMATIIPTVRVPICGPMGAHVALSDGHDGFSCPLGTGRLPRHDLKQRFSTLLGKRHT